MAIKQKNNSLPFFKIGNTPRKKMYLGTNLVYNLEAPPGAPAGEAVVRDGLLLYWDAAFTESYPGTGTVIYDLSGNGNNGAIQGTVTKQSNNGGVFQWYNDANQGNYIKGVTPNLTSTNFTVMGASKKIGGSHDGRIFTSEGNNWLIGHWRNSTQNYFPFGSVCLGCGPDDLNWRIYAGTGDISGDSYSLYVNNSLSSGPSSAGSEGPNGMNIGYSGTDLEGSNGEAGFLLIYNRVLTTGEMTTNYNLFKDRYGL